VEAVSDDGELIPFDLSEGCTPVWAAPPRNLIPVAFQARSHPDSLRYLAGKLREGTDPEAVAFALDVLADQSGPVVGG
jgi:hypothetical protein